MGGQIVDASIIAAPKQRNTNAEKRDIKEGRIPAGWADKPAKLAQKGRDARWTVKWSKAKPAEDGSPCMDLAVPAFGYKNHVGIDRRHGLIRTWSVTDAARHDGTQLPTLISKANTGSDVWGDTAYRSRANERLLAENGRRSQIHRKKPPRKPMPKHTARANGARSKVRAAVEHVFAHEKGPTDLASAEPNQPTHPSREGSWRCPAVRAGHNQAVTTSGATPTALRPRSSRAVGRLLRARGAGKRNLRGWGTGPK